MLYSMLYCVNVCDVVQRGECPESVHAKHNRLQLTLWGLHRTFLP